MQLSNRELLQLADSAISAACQAGDLIRKYPTQEVVVESKTAGDNIASQVVTQVDYFSQKLILKSLLSSCDKFDIALLTEESIDNQKRLQKDYFWCIDPLDGTLPFIESKPGYAVSIALVSRAGIPLIGVIYDPLKQILYHAIKDVGAFRNKTPWRLEQTQLPEKLLLTLVCDRSFVQQKHYTQVIKALEIIADELGYKGLNTIMHGGAVMNACWVLENNPGCYFKFPKLQNGGGSLWDYAATACLFNELGAVVCDIHGGPLDLNRADSTFMNHRGIIYSCEQILAKRISDLYINLN
jgi:myo-inositol-1(or 4)-monophosphatase